jgi:hypothetical protein
LRAGLPTVVVPFFGDQFFWGRVVADAGAGPEPIPIRRLTSEALTAAFDVCRRPRVRERASELGARLRATDGVALTVQSIERHLPVSAMRCAESPDHLAVVFCDTCGVRLCQDCSASAHAGHVVHPYRPVDWSRRPPHGLAAELSDIVGDAAQALQAGLAEIWPSITLGRGGVVFTDGDEREGTSIGGPVRKLRRWLGSW